MTHDVGMLDGSATLAELWERTVRAYPGNTAIVSDDETLTYAEANERANRLARLLIERGAGPERMVALALPRSVHMVVGVIAVAKADAAFLPIDIRYPAERVHAMLSDAAPALLCTTSAATRNLPDDPPVRRIVLDATEDAAALAALDAADIVGRRGSTANLAYVIYTSGSTGRPKGVAVTHAGLAGLAAVKVASLQVTSDSRVLQFMSPSFDAFLTELLGTFAAGAALVVPAGATLVGQQLTKALRDNAISHAVLPPAAAATVSPADVPDLRTLVLAGEACPPDLLARWAQGRRVINSYGPTEATVCASTSDALDGKEEVTIGRPIPGASVYILDDRLRPVPPGDAGEMYIGGVGLARGYLRQPGRTAERFVANPFGGDGARMYRTGDLAAWRADGAIRFHGRLDNQVKLRGFRIELGEVEAVLGTHPDVGHVVAVVRGDGDNDARLVAYVVPANGAAPTPDALREHAVRYLPAFMVPSVYSMIDAIPLTPNGKADRAALPDPTVPAPRPARPPRTPAEEALCSIFRQLFDDAEITVYSNFYELGGTSIRAMDLIQLAREQAGLKILPCGVVNHPTVEAMAAAATPIEVGEVTR
ncbi:amino acid adenylation domain-containing protein [Nocardia arthritidis]|uniref:Amino acid adenylation domain-containing protein n=1 Tax=Nocardia arthritidis TaxID=228602 RepID=A0A6G9YC38_9NOCA|nr:amino acid adenylation domain-containing protein [Nocardia arthritidis]QIS10724.1 amino acid adenylation domain-containing protein [Nocardia arthritidis]